MIKPRCWGTCTFLHKTPLLFEGLFMRKEGLTANRTQYVQRRDSNKEIGGGGSARSCPLGQESSSQFREQTLFNFTDAIFFILSENLPCELVRQRPHVHFVQFQVSYCRVLIYF